MWNEKTVPANPHAPDCTGIPMNNQGLETIQKNQGQGTDWLDILSDAETVILDDNKKSDDLADISPTVKVDESDFMHYTIEEMKLEWPPELKVPTQGPAESVPPVPVPETLPGNNPLPVLSNSTVSGVLGNLPPVTPPRPPSATRPSFFASGRTINQFTGTRLVANCGNVLYLPLALEDNQKLSKGDGQVQLLTPSKSPPGQPMLPSKLPPGKPLPPWRWSGQPKSPWKLPPGQPLPLHPSELPPGQLLHQTIFPPRQPQHPSKLPPGQPLHPSKLPLGQLLHPSTFPPQQPQHPSTFPPQQPQHPSKLPPGPPLRPSILPPGQPLPPSKLILRQTLHSSTLPPGQPLHPLTLPPGQPLHPLTLPPGQPLHPSALPPGQLLCQSRLPPEQPLQLSTLPLGQPVRPSTLPPGQPLHQSKLPVPLGQPLPPSNLPLGNDARKPRRMQESEVETDSAGSESSWRASSDDDYAKKFEREDQMEGLLECYQNGGINTDDYFIYCELCNRRWRRCCPQHGKLKHIKDKMIPLGTEGRARKTAPWLLLILPSKIKGAKNGVWTRKSIPNRSYFGPYEGCEVPLDHANTEYCWKVTHDGKPPCLVDGSDPSQSNWMRYVNCARTEEEQNLEAFQYKGAIFYRTTKVIDENQELLVWYGFKFARKLGIKWKDFVESHLPHQKGSVFPCGSCFHAYANPIVLEKHWRRSSRCKHSLSLLRDSVDRPAERETVCPLPIEGTGTPICMEVTTGGMPIVCGVCGARFRRRGKPLQYHVASHSDRKHDCCLKCGRWFPDDAALSEHKIAASQTPKESPDSSQKADEICDLKSSKIRIKPVKKEPKLPESTETLPSTVATSENGTNKDSPISHNRVNEDRPISHTGMKEERPISHSGDVEVPPISLKKEPTEVDLRDRPNSHTGANDDQLISRAEKNEDPLIPRSTENKPGDEVKGTGTSGPVLRSCYDKMLCDKCGAMFLRPSLLASHLELQHGIKSKEKEMFAKTCQPMRFKCKECGILYRKKETLEEHLKLHEDTSENEVSADADEEKFACDKCEMKFRAEITLKFHMEVHKEKTNTSADVQQPKKFKCKECHVRFRARSTLKLHRRTHTEEKRRTSKWGSTLRSRPNKTFFSGSIIKKRHQTEEGAELPMTQTGCLSGGAPTGMGGPVVQEEKGNLPHRGRPKGSKRKDIPSGGVPSKKPRRASCLECLACGFIFKDRTGLDMHVRTHTEGKMLVCDLSRVRVAE